MLSTVCNHGQVSRGCMLMQSTTRHSTLEVNGLVGSNPPPSMRACPDGGNNWQLPRQKPSARALHRVYSVEATFGSEKRCFHRYETGGEPWPVSAASSHQLSPHWHEASGSESQEKMLHSVAEAGRGGENAMGSRKFIGISSLECCEMWVKHMRSSASSLCDGTNSAAARLKGG